MPSPKLLKSRKKNLYLFIQQKVPKSEKYTIKAKYRIKVIDSVMLRFLGLMVMIVLVFSFGAPHQPAQAMFHEHVENLVDGLFKSKPDPIYPYPRNDQQRIINDLHSNHPNIEQKDIDIAYHGLVNECIKYNDNPNDQPRSAGFIFGCKAGNHFILTSYLSDWGYNYLSDIPKTDPPQLYLPRDDRWEQ